MQGRKGFTLIELVTVVMIIGILASVAAAKYGNLVRKANEGELQGNLGAMRSALSIYYADLEGQFPASLTVLSVSSRYIKQLPQAEPPPYHGNSSAVFLGAASDDSGGWGYNDVQGNARHGTVFVNCTHTDSKGTSWAAY